MHVTCMAIYFPVHLDHAYRTHHRVDRVLEIPVSLHARVYADEQGNVKTGKAPAPFPL